MFRRNKEPHELFKFLGEKGAGRRYLSTLFYCNYKRFMLVPLLYFKIMKCYCMKKLLIKFGSIRVFKHWLFQNL